MGWVEARRTAKGKERFRAQYRDERGKKRSAGTYETEKLAIRAWQAAETHVAEGRHIDPRRGRQKFENYVRETWLPNHVVELSTRQNYTYYINRYLLPEFGGMSLRDVQPSDIRAWITRLGAEGVSLESIRYCKIVLSAIFTTAFDDQIVPFHPCRGVRTPAVPKTPRRIITSEQFDTVYEALQNAEFQLLVETAIESGLRWGELTELRSKDLDFDTRILIVSRAVIQLVMKNSPDGKRFAIKLPKDNEIRRLKLSKQIVKKLRKHVRGLGLGPEDLLFAIRDLRPQRPLRPVPDPDALGMTEPNAKGRSYKHGTMSGYSLGGCRCRGCKDSYAIYRAQRRAAGKDDPRAGRTLTTDGHLQVVKERLGHGSITTTEKYLHTLPDADDTALDALANIRAPKRKRKSA
jgi:integrase